MWKAIKEIKCGDAEGTYRIRHSKGMLIVEKQVKDWIDVTSECNSRLIESHRSAEIGDSARYLAILHGDKVIAVYRPSGQLERRYPDVYRISLAPGATYSFRVYQRQ